MFRRLMQILKAISFISFLVITAFWVRGYWKSEHIQFTWKKEIWELTSADGKISIDNRPEIAKQRAAMQSVVNALRTAMDAKENEFRESEHLGDAPMFKLADSALESRRYYILGVPNDGKRRGNPQIDREKLEIIQTALKESLDVQIKLHGESSKLHYKWTGQMFAMLGLAVCSVTISPPLLAMLMTANLILPILWCRRCLIRRGRAKSDLCVSCGYDLRATPDRCPECGAVAGRR